jgi:glucose-6-phosphate-specific signal transduction histidine kinase
MSASTRKILRWAPRALCIAFTIFISLFALDAFGHGKGFWGTLADLLRHLVPSFVLLATLALAWRWEWIGAVVCTALAALFLWWNFTFRHNVPSAVIAIAGPLCLMAALYLFNWVKRGEIRRAG